MCENENTILDSMLNLKTLQKKKLLTLKGVEFQASFMPVLVLAARLCPEGVEATLFATLMSISNGGGLAGGLLGAGLTQIFGVTKDNFDHLATLIIVCNLSSLLPLPLLRLLPKNGPNNTSERQDFGEAKLSQFLKDEYDNLLIHLSWKQLAPSFLLYTIYQKSQEIPTMNGKRIQSI